MHNFVIFLLSALAASSLCHGYLGEDPDTDHFESFCLTEIRPLLDKVIKSQSRPRFQAQFREMSAKLLGVEDQLKEQRTILTKMEDSQAKLTESLLAIQSKLDNQHRDVFEEVENHMPLPGFVLIGTRYFRIINESVDWETANRRCRDLGGYLASFRNKDELTAVIENVDELATYWLGINDQKTEGHFVSVASNKPAQYLNWMREQPTDEHHTLNCVSLFNGLMWDEKCDFIYNFICQADNKI